MHSYRLSKLALAAGLSAVAGPAAVAADGNFAVELSSAAFDTSPVAGDVLRFEATVTGGVSPHTFEWDLDADGETDRASSSASIEASYPRRTQTQVTVRVTDAAGASVDSSRALVVRGPKIQIELINELRLSGLQQLRLTNVGDAPQPAGHAIFAPELGAPVIEMGSFNQIATTSENIFCSSQWIDIVEGPDAVPALMTFVADGNSRGIRDNARTDTIILGAGGVRLSGESWRRAVMSTNGYVSLELASGGTESTGAESAPSCAADVTYELATPQLRPFRSDLIISGQDDVSAAGAGLRYRHFPICPRPDVDGMDLPCHVFSWSGMQRIDAIPSDLPFDFQAVAYEGSAEVAYQYRGDVPQDGVPTSVGFAHQGGENFNIVCGVVQPARVAADASVCTFGSQTAQAAFRPAVELDAGYKVALPTLAVGETFSTEIRIKSIAGTRCGQKVVVDFLGTVSATGHSFDRQRVVDSLQNTPCPVPRTPLGPIILPPPPPSMDRHNGLFFNHARPGNGLVSFAQYTDRVYDRPIRESFAGGWYTALPDRTPVWYTLQGNLLVGDGELKIRRFRNSAAPDGVAPIGELVGRAYLRYLNRTTALFAWELDDGSTGIERMQTSLFELGSNNHSQTWFDRTEPGWGLAIETLNANGPFEFFGVFIYDAAGEPRWVSGANNRASGSFALMSAFRPHCPSCPWIVDWNSDAAYAGLLSIIYNRSPTVATLATSIILPPDYFGLWERYQSALYPTGPIDPVP